MSQYKRYGLFPIYKSDQPQDWQLEGYYNTFKNAFQFVPRDVLVSFRTPPVSGTKTAPTQITIRKLSIKAAAKTIVSSDVYNVTMYEEHANSQTYYYFIQSAITSIAAEFLDVGELYELYIEDADGNSFISNIFIAVDETELFIQTEGGLNILTEDGDEILY